MPNETRLAPPRYTIPDFFSSLLEDSANLPDPDVIAAEIAEDLQSALDQFSLIAADLKPKAS
jgi:hypothetical protein